MTNPINEKIPASIFVLSLLSAFFLDIKAVNWALVNGGFYETGLMNTLFPVTILSILFLGLFKFFFPSLKKEMDGWLLVWYLLCFYLVSVTYIGPPLTESNMFLGFTIAGLFIPLISRVDTCLMLKSIMIFPSFALLRLGMVFVPDLSTGSISMDASYGFIIPITASIVYYFTYFKNERSYHKLLTILLFFTNGVFLGILLAFGSRGPLLGLICVFAFLYVVSCDTRIKVNKKRLRRLLIISLCGVIFFSSIVVFINDILRSNGIDLYFLNKLVRLDKEGNLSNGREDLVYVAFMGFLDSPLLGHGFDRFNAHTNLLYPHNFILQILYDGGLLLFGILILPTIRAIKLKYKCCDKSEFAMITFLLFASVPGALFSQNLWMIGPLWLFVGYLKSKIYVYKPVYRV